MIRTHFSPEARVRDGPHRDQVFELRSEIQDGKTMDSARSVYSKFLKAIPKTYAELRDFFEKERPDRLQALIPRRINAPSVYWPQPEESAWYYKTISVIGGETMKSAFERASKIPYLCGDRDSERLGALI
jgi:hypothetical protein